MPKFCCFFCPKGDYSEKNIRDLCPTCSRPYSFPLDFPPVKIKNFKIVKHLNRGFYGATYIAEREGLGAKIVLKISPVTFYTFKPFNKPDFFEEAKMHLKLADHASHIVGIQDAFEEKVIFSDQGGTDLPCYVSVLNFIEGKPLREYIEGGLPVTVAEVCQFTIDLLNIRSELEANQLNHNDLHADNLIVEAIRPEARRRDVQGSVKVMAIDLGSIADGSKSDEKRLGDFNFIGSHIDLLLDKLLKNQATLEDRDFRIALGLQGIVQGFLSNAQNVRVPNTSDFVEKIRESFYRANHHWRPWSEPLRLKGFGDHYNAQTLESWDVPRLLVDPDNRWISEVSKPGPQIVTGMRGCGKTMLLRALDIHARASQEDGETPQAVVQRIEKDKFVGLFVSAQRLLDSKELSQSNRITRLFVSYALQASRALLHISDLQEDAVAHNAHTKIASAIVDFLSGAESLLQATSIEELERQLEKILVLTIKGDKKYEVLASPSDVFTHFAKKFRDCSKIFESATVFYLLDDVSTRYLEIDGIGELLSVLLFQNQYCAFKFTSEWQTIELGLKSPGKNHPIRIDRDLSVFDLGADVFETINGKGNRGKNFVASILRRRARVHPAHPPYQDPKKIIGDVSLEQVANEIASSEDTSNQRKRVYRGLSCLTGVCVGDIGDVIKLYEEILRRAGNQPEIPVKDSIQSDCFLDINSRRLFDLKRRRGYFSEHALAFARASHDLLVRSKKNGKDGEKKDTRLRQFSHIYVRVTTENSDDGQKQIDMLRELIDAGVFVFAGIAPRTKTRDSDPTQQFILAFRKIYGLAAYIGLADRDRFELSGKDLKLWLENPNMAQEILLRNQIRSEVQDEEGRVDGAVEETEGDADDGAADLERNRGPRLASPALALQEDLFHSQGNQGELAVRFADVQPKEIDVSIRTIGIDEVASSGVQSIFLGLGFEDRTLATTALLSSRLNPAHVHGIRYSVLGRSSEILEHWKKTSVSEGPSSSPVSSLALPDGLALIDTTGLTKPWIFASIRNELIRKGRVIVCHTTAQSYYPLHEDLEPLVHPEGTKNIPAFLEKLTQVLTGEMGPYKEVSLLESEVDPSRNRALVAFASSKHERLFSLIEGREFDRVEVIAPDGDKPRDKVARLAAEFACQTHSNAVVQMAETRDLVKLLSFLDKKYLELYSGSRANFELGLTGSKTEAIAAAVLSSRRKVAQAWYISPAQFDEKKFSTGVGRTYFYDIEVK
jgi:hypothetical protein